MNRRAIGGKKELSAAGKERAFSEGGGERNPSPEEKGDTSVIKGRAPTYDATG